MGLNSIVRSKGFKNFMAKLYGWGASLVILGALFKINHYPGAGLMLVIGMGTEAIIFFFSAFEPPHVEPDWSLVYPELAGMYEGYTEDPIAELEGSGNSNTQALDNMLEEAKIGPELIASLGAGLRSLSDNASKLSNITDASVATEEYAGKIKTASKNIGELSDTYAKSVILLNNATEKIAKSAESIDFSQIDGSAFNDELAKVSKNLSALNSVYEIQLQSSNEQTDTLAQMGTSMNAFLENLNKSVENTSKYTEQAAQLADNVAKLNNVYGNMLTAMNVNR